VKIGEGRTADDILRHTHSLKTTTTALMLMHCQSFYLI
jgi:hypothetical protein